MVREDRRLCWRESGVQAGNRELYLVAHSS